LKAADGRIRVPGWAPAAAALAVVLLFVGTAGWWPWDHDEVLSLVEVGFAAPHQYPGPVAQVERMHRLLPVWYALQHTALRVLPSTEWGTRLLPSSAGALAVIVAFLAARRWRGEWFGWSLLVLTGGSQSLIWLSQQNRFYPIALLWLTLGFVVAWSRWKGPWAVVLTSALAAIAVLTHSLTVVVIGLGGIAALVGLPFGWVTRRAAVRLLAAAASAGAVYLFYARPILSGWVSGNTGGTNPLVSFVAQMGTPVLALALVGAASAFLSARDQALRWWVAVAGLGMVFLGVVPFALPNWNPRYAIFFMPAFWVVAAYGTATIGESLRGGLVRFAWLACVACLLLPKFASHFADGSRHNFRTAAEVVEQVAPGDLVYSNWPATLQYYLEPATGQRVGDWPPMPMPGPGSGHYMVVIASNAWEPILDVPGKRTDVVTTIARRRFDEQSHVIRVYRVTSVP
jgi:hypothetical protein